MKTLVIGLGNPILADDSVGIKVSQIVKKKIKDRTDLICHVSEFSTGGIRLMDAMIGYERVIIIDAIVTDSGASPGTVYALSPYDVLVTRNSFSSHDTHLSVCLEMGKMLGLHLPSEIKIWAVEAEDVDTFSENLSDNVEKSVPIVVQQILHVLEAKKGG